MVMTLGSASVDDAGVVTKSGVIGRFYDQLYASTLASIQGGWPSGTVGLNLKRAIATNATNQGTVLFTVLTSDAQAKIATTDTGLQRLPSPADPNASTIGPSGNKFLSIV
jgi:hypothetical protein